MSDGWTNSEKKIARRVFEEARQKVLAKALATFKAEAAAADEAPAKPKKAPAKKKSEA